MFTRVVLFSDSTLNNKFLKFFKKNLVAIVAASIRPISHKMLKEISDKQQVPFFIQPKPKDESYSNFINKLKYLKPDLFFINSYSMIFKKDLLKLPKSGTLNIHTSLLPKNRGANPLQWGIINQDEFAGVTLHEVDEGIDSGPIIDQRKTNIFTEDTWVSLSNRIKDLTYDLIEKNINQILSKNWDSKPQNKNQATYNNRRSPKDGEINWSMPIIEIYNKIRALISPLPGAFYFLNSKKILINSFTSLYELIQMNYIFEKSKFTLKNRYSLIPSLSTQKKKNKLIKFSVKENDNLIGYFEIKIHKDMWRFELVVQNIYEEELQNEINYFFNREFKMLKNE
jgi:methionyl-tRNA formyltransferase